MFIHNEERRELRSRGAWSGCVKFAGARQVPKPSLRFYVRPTCVLCPISYGISYGRTFAVHIKFMGVDVFRPLLNSGVQNLTWYFKE